MNVNFKVTDNSHLSALPIADGQIITLTDTSGMYYDMNGVRNKVYRDASVFTNSLNPTLQTTTQNGITCTRNVDSNGNFDGTYTLQPGTASNNVVLYYNNSANILSNIYAGLKFIGCPSSGSAATVTSIVSYYTGATWMREDYEFGDGLIIKPEYNGVHFGVYIRKGAVITSPIVLKPMITTNLSATYDDFVPFTGTSGKLNKDVAVHETSISTIKNDISTIKNDIMANMINPTFGTWTDGHITVTKNEDRTYTINGTPTYDEFLTIQNLSLPAGLNLRLVGCPTGYGLNKAIVYIGNRDICDAGLGVTFVTNGTEDAVKIALYKGVTFNNVIFKPMITTNLSATYSDYVPYTGTSGQLNKDVSIHEASIRGLVKHTVANSLKPTLQTTTSNGITCTNNGDGTYTLQPGTATGDIAFRLFASITAPNKYKGMKLVGCPNIHNAHYNIFVNYCTDTAWEGVAQEFGDGLILSSDTKYTRIVFSIIVSSGEVISTPLVFKPMITTDLSATYSDYVPYTGTSGQLNEDVAAHETSISTLKVDLNKESFTAKNFKGDLELIAHRGFTSLYPENTIYAARKAIKLGASPEFDVQFTQDGEMVVIHDDTVNRTTNGTGSVASLTYSYISGLDAGTKFNSYFNGIHVPLFTDYLTAVQNTKHIYPELKGYRTTDDIATFVNAIIDAGFEERCTIQSFSYSSVLSYIRAVSSKIRVGCLVQDQTQFNNVFSSLVVPDNNSMMLISSSIATLENLQICKQYNVDVAVWTINNIATLNSLVKLGYKKLMCNQYMEVTL